MTRQRLVGLIGGAVLLGSSLAQAAPRPEPEPTRIAYVRAPGGGVYSVMRLPLFDVVPLRQGGSGGGGVTVGGNNTWTGTNSFSNSVTFLTGSGPTLSGANNFFSFTNAVFRNNTAQTPDTFSIETTPTSNAIIIIENADAGFDFAHPQSTQPRLFIHDEVQSTSRWIGFWQENLLGVIASGNAGLVWRGNSASNNYMYWDTGGSSMVSTYFFGWVSSGSNAAGITDTNFSRESAAVVQMGADVNGAAIAQTLKAHDGITGTDIAGANLTVAGGRGTGAGNSGDLILSTSPKLATGTTAQTLEVRGRVVSEQFALADNTIATFDVITLGDDKQGGGTIEYCVYANDATTAALECGSIDFAGIDVTAGAGGEVCTNPTKIGTPIQALSGATLAVTFTATTGTDLCNLRVTSDHNIATPLNHWIKWTLSQGSGAAHTPQ